MFETREERQNFYNSIEWRNFREYILANEPFCRICKANGYFEGATCVDHIKDIEEAPELRLEKKNCQSLCKNCHSRKTMSKAMKINNTANTNRKPGHIKRKFDL